MSKEPKPTNTLQHLAFRLAQADGYQIGQASDFADWHWEDYVYPARAAVEFLKNSGFIVREVDGPMTTITEETIITAAALPEGEYAIVELMGHQTVVGRVSEIERFGTKFMQIEPIYLGKLLAPILQGGPSIYRCTPCSAETAFARAPKRDYMLPAVVRATLPPHLLAAPAEGASHERGVFTGADEETLFP